MKIDKKVLKVNDSLYRKLKNTCNFSNVKLDIIKGIIFIIEDTNLRYLLFFIGAYD